MKTILILAVFTLLTTIAKTQATTLIGDLGGKLIDTNYRCHEITGGFHLIAAADTTIYWDHNGTSGVRITGGFHLIADTTVYWDHNGDTSGVRLPKRIFKNSGNVIWDSSHNSGSIYHLATKKKWPILIN